MTITAAVDGSALGNPGPAGWSWVIADDAWAAGGWDQATNNVGELTALARLLEDTAEAGLSDQDLVVLADSQYVINSVTKWMPGWKRKGWKKADGQPVANRELMERIDRAITGRSVRFEWVKGHAGHALNEAADLRARAAAEAHKSGRQVPRGPGLTNVIGSRVVVRAKASARDERGRDGSVTQRSETERQHLDVVSVQQAHEQWGRVIASARREPVTITDPAGPSLVLMDADLAWRALAMMEEPSPDRLF